MNKLEKENISRKSIKSNILNTIVITFEYRGLNDLENNITKIIKGIDDRFYSYEILEFQDTNINTNEFFNKTKNDIYRSNCFIIKNEEENEILTLNKYFVQYKIHCTKYEKFTDYKNVFNNVILNLKKITSFFKPLTLSHRKINLCILKKDMEKLNDYFEKEYYHIPNLAKYLEKEIDNFLSWESSNRFYKNNIEFELKNMVDLGEYEGKLAMRIIADIKGSAEFEILKYEERYDDLLDKINEEVFNIFKDIITEKFLNQMINLDWNNDVIEGVGKNE